MRGRTKELWDLWYYFNDRYFGGKLTPPATIRITRAKKYDGTLYYKGNRAYTHFHLGTYKNRILIAGRQSIERQSATLLHEMVHQYQLQVWQVEPDHDHRFKSYCRWIERQTKFRLR